MCILVSGTVLTSCALRDAVFSAKRGRPVPRKGPAVPRRIPPVCLYCPVCSFARPVIDIHEPAARVLQLSPENLGLQPIWRMHADNTFLRVCVARAPVCRHGAAAAESAIEVRVGQAHACAWTLLFLARAMQT